MWTLVNFRQIVTFLRSCWRRSTNDARAAGRCFCLSTPRNYQLPPRASQIHDDDGDDDDGDDDDGYLLLPLNV